MIQSGTALEKNIITNRFILRSLTVDDASQEYLSWLSDTSTSQFILSASSFDGLTSLRHFIKLKTEQKNVLFIGIFSKAEMKHIGNIKFEKSNSNEKYAEMGILIGSKEWRGKGVFSEIFLASVSDIKKILNVENIILGVSKENVAAVKSYLKTGFEYSSNEILKVAEDSYEMTFRC